MTDQQTPASPFLELGLCKELADTVAQQGYTEPTPIQAKAIPPILEGKDVMAAAQTGTGKTAGFTLPILDRLRHAPRVKAKQAKVLILTPTRELALQVAESVKSYSKNLDLTSTVVYGGVKINPQKRHLAPGVDVLIATPGRLLDLYSQRAVSFPHLEVLVLDEADRMLDMGFINDIRKIMATLPTRRQSLLFSATFSKEIRTLAKGIISSPVEISVTPPNSTVDAIEQSIYAVSKKEKPAVLEALIKQHGWHHVLVFCRTKHGCDKLTRVLEKKGIKAAAIHGNKSQGQRVRALDQFKRLDISVLVATDIAARGLDIEQLPYVLNMELPNVPEDYVHRIGRTGRAGATGQAVSLVSEEEFELLINVEYFIKKILPRETMADVAAPLTLAPSSIDKKPFISKQKNRGNSSQKRRPYTGPKRSGGRPSRR